MAGFLSTECFGIGCPDMDTITALTLAKMLQIEANGVVDADVVVNNLVLTRHDGSTTDLGNVRGPQGRSANFSTELGYYVNLNDLTEAGTYAQSSNVEAVSGTNYPVPWAGLLKVEADALSTMLFQTYTVYNGSMFAGITFVRVRDAGVWSAWDAFGKGPWVNIDFTGSSGWIAYGSTWRVPQYQIQGSNVTLRGLTKVYFLNDTNTDVGYGFGGIENLPPPKKNYIFTGIAARTSITSTALSHNHTNGVFNARIDVGIDTLSYANPCAQVTVVANGSNYFAGGAYCSLSGISWDWVS